jgi:hypothetical protein
MTATGAEQSVGSETGVRMSKLTVRSIWFASCVSIGLLLGYLDGFSTKALVKTGLIAAVLFVAFLLAESLWQKSRK